MTNENGRLIKKQEDIKKLMNKALKTLALALSLITPENPLDLFNQAYQLGDIEQATKIISEHTELLAIHKFKSLLIEMLKGRSETQLNYLKKNIELGTVNLGTVDQLTLKAKNLQKISDNQLSILKKMIELSTVDQLILRDLDAFYTSKEQSVIKLALPYPELVKALFQHKDFAEELMEQDKILKASDEVTSLFREAFIILTNEIMAIRSNSIEVPGKKELEPTTLNLTKNIKLSIITLLNNLDPAAFDYQDLLFIRQNIGYVFEQLNIGTETSGLTFLNIGKQTKQEFLQQIYDVIEALIVRNPKIIMDNFVGENYEVPNIIRLFIAISYNEFKTESMKSFLAIILKFYKKQLEKQKEKSFKLTQELFKRLRLPDEKNQKKNLEVGKEYTPTEFFKAINLEKYLYNG